MESTCANKLKRTSSELFNEDYPYEVVNDDHCETPVEAYETIKILLFSLAHVLGKSSKDLLIYDPFYCEGGAKERLNSLGFESVYNVKEDFYKVYNSNSLPVFDVLITNPPYSGSHIENIVRICSELNKPWFLLLPNYVYTKEYYKELPHRGIHSTFYVTSTKQRYLYTTPKGRRQTKSAKYTAPYPTFWYCCLKNLSRTVLQHYHSHPDLEKSEAIQLVMSENKIPIEHAPDNDPRKKKLRNAMKRKKNKDKKKIKKVSV